MINRMGIAFMRFIARWPLSWVRALGVVLGGLLYLVVWPRRHVANVNLALCFPHWSARERRHLVPRLFVNIAQSWLDRGWLWHAPADVVRSRLRLTGAVGELQGERPTVVFAPHFVGMDAGWIALTLYAARPAAGIYTQQSNKALDEWILEGRSRFSSGRPFGRADGVRELVAALRRGELLYLLPDMNFGPEESIFVPFYGVPAATVPSLSRFARLGRAKVVPMISRMTPQGYEVEVMPAWDDVPSDDLVADTALMNARLQSYIDAMPDQYYWVHRRFKTRPEGQPGVY